MKIKALLKQQALPTYEAAIAEHPEHFYLYDAKKYIEYMQSKTDAGIQQLYQRYVGDYGEARIWIEDGQLFFKIPGDSRRILRPISDTEFMNLYSYESKYVFEVKNGRVQGISSLKYNNEAKEWRKDDTLYYARTKLAD